MAVKKRCTSRVLLVDHGDRLLLLCGRDPRREGARWWYTVGGEVEDGEDYVSAALRETWEETGLRLAASRLGPLLWTRRARFTWDGQAFDQYEEYRLARVTADEAAGIRVDHEGARHGHAWWSVAELAATREAVRPKRLARLLPPVLDGSAGAGPLHLGDVDEEHDPE
ncbi:NUDIX hydrolase [Streptomyces griseosporeus]|uniref:NUDIX hydrolase n=1 Tax=Streptomyces griseosporeus TaxID=1910 RepID=UPI0037B9C093